VTFVHSDTSKRGATFLAKNTPLTVRGILIDLVRENPKLDKELLFERFQQAISEDAEYLEAIQRYFFINNYNAVMTELRGEAAEGQRSTGFAAPATVATSMARRIEREATVSAGVERATRQIALLFLTMPNGKAMRYCTGTEMAKFGAGYAKIAKRAGSKTVGEVLNEDEVRKLMGYRLRRAPRKPVPPSVPPA